MQALKKIELEDFRMKTTPHFNGILRTALRLTENQAEAEALTTEVYLQAWKAFCFYKPELDCRAWLLKILFRKFHRYRDKSFNSEFVEDWNKMLKSADSLDIDSNKKSFV